MNIATNVPHPSNNVYHSSFQRFTRIFIVRNIPYMFVISLHQQTTFSNPQPFDQVERKCHVPIIYFAN